MSESAQPSQHVHSRPTGSHNARRLAVGVFCAILGVALSVECIAVPVNGEVLLGREGGRAELDEAEVDGRLLVTIDTPYQVFDDAGTLIHVAAWAPDGRPAAGAEVYLADHFVGRTDGAGAMAFRWGVPGNDLESYWTSGSSVSVRWDDDGTVRGGSVWFSAFSRTESYESDHLYVYTDRGVYAPGDTVRARLIGWHLAADYAPIEGGEVELLLVGPDGATVAGAEVTTDEFGVAHAELTLASTLAEGAYRLDVNYAGATAMTRLRVERYVPPVMHLDHTLGRFITRDTERLEWELGVRYFEGGYPDEVVVTTTASVRGAVRYTASRRVVGAGPHAFAIEPDELAEVVDGLLDREMVTVRITVEDEDGRVDQLSRDMTYALNPYIAVIEADRDAWSEGDPVELIVRLTDIERVPMRDTAVRLETDDGRTFTARTDDAGTAQISLEMGDHGFEVRVFVDDVDAPLATRWLDWQEPQPMRSHIADAVVREHEETRVRVTFPADFRPVEEFVHMDVTDISGSIVNSVLLPVRERDGEVYAEGDFSAPSWGSMLLTFFCLGEGPQEVAVDPDDDASSPLGLLTEGQNLAVHPGRDLSITLDGVPDQVSPGQALDGQVVVRDASGRRVDAAVGVAMVDEAVISLKDPLEITPMDHFYNPELRVISTTGNAILTWPVVSRNWGHQTHDIALPPFPYKAGGPIETQLHRMAEADGEEAADYGTAGFGLAGGGSGVGSMSGSVMGYGAGMAAAEPESVTIALEGQLDEMDNAQGRTRASRGEQAEETVTITVRTEAPDTSLWAPELRAVAGRAELSATAPDAITRQHIMIVASDAAGGVGVLRRSVSVTQPISVRSDLRAEVDRGVRVDGRFTVTNRSDQARRLTVSVESADLRVLGEPVLVDVPAGGTAVAVVPFVADAAGPAAFRVFANDGTDGDAVEASVFVRPTGERTEEVTAAVVEPGGGFARVAGTGPPPEWEELTLSVTFPALTSAFAGVDVLAARLSDQPIDRLAGDIVTALLVYEARAATNAPDLSDVRARLQAAITRIEDAAADDGGWQAWWADASSPYLTAWCLEALTEARRLDFTVRGEVIDGAITYLLAALEGGPLSLRTIDFWEGDTASVELGVRMEALRVLARIPAERLPEGASERIVALAESSVGILDDASPDVMALAHLVGALGTLASDGRGVVSEERLVAAIGSLDALRREGHWEPSWFNAYGGTIEATVTVLEVLRDVEVPASRDLLDRVSRDALRYLMSTSDALGSWHNERGSAWLLRGLALVAAPAPAEAGTVRVVIDGETVLEVEIDPDDPYASAHALRTVDLSEYVRAGAEQISVAVDGGAAPRVEFVHRVWN